MGIIKDVPPSSLIAGITFSESADIEAVTGELEKSFGSIELRSPVFDFVMTDYYEKEMGSDLKKVFFSFSPIFDIALLPDVKLKTNSIELVHAEISGDIIKRRVNIDPGYITLSKLILASTKDYSHRVYIGRGIFGEYTLRFIQGEFRPCETTYPDYQTQLSLKFFNDARTILKEKIDSLRLK